ncbi:MAG: hypothetical protein CR991_01705 [Proteobacteria bacterium]|nr:MAG: hypothetical protein CR991_01705 [Pseudomonadota bacterium]
MSYDHYKGRADRMSSTRNRYRVPPTGSEVNDFDRIFLGNDDLKQPRQETHKSTDLPRPKAD